MLEISQVILNRSMVMRSSEFLAKEEWVEILEWAPCGFLLVDNEKKIVSANRKAAQMLGAEPEALLGRPVGETLQLSGPDENQPKAFKRKEINGREVVFYKAPLQIGDRMKGEMFILDELVDFKFKSSLSLAFESDQTLNSVIESFHDGVVFVENGRVVKVNGSFGRITGLKDQAILGRKLEDLDGETHVCLHTIQEVVRLVHQARKSVTSMGKLTKGNEIYVTGTPLWQDDAFDHIIVNIRDVTELQILKEEVSRIMALYLSTPEEVRLSNLTAGEIIAENRVIKGILDMIARVSQVDTVVLFEGESGTGKEILARLLHRLSARKKGPLIPVNCGAIPENLFESELFGYAKGAFTGALKEGKPGLFELAEGGILFLDEIGELPLNCQVKLLKVIEDHALMRVGGVKPVRLNVRVIAATNRNLHKMVKDRKFREDLYYRLNVVPIKIPPLRERREDIFPLAWHFLGQYNRKFGQAKTFSPGIIQVLESYQWPGNVRELKHVIERLVITTDGNLLEEHHLPSSIYDKGNDDGSIVQVRGITSLSQAREMVEKKMIAHAMAARGTVREAARLLRVDHSTVVRKAKKYGLNLGDELRKQKGSQ